MEVHDACLDARDGMSGVIDYGVVLKVMGLMHIDDEEQLEVMGKIRAVERELKEWGKEAKDKPKGK